MIRAPIYLRWANRRELMVAAVADLRAPIVTEHTGSTRADLLRSLMEDRELLVAGADARFLRSVLFESESDAEIAQELESGILGPPASAWWRSWRAVCVRGRSATRSSPKASPACWPAR